LHHSSKGQSTPARELWDVCKDSAAGWWKPAEFGDQLALPVVERTAAFEPVTADQRAAWRSDHDAVISRANERRVFAATAVAALDQPVDVARADDESTATLPPAMRRGGTALGRAVHAVLATIDFDAPDDLAALAAAEAAVEGIADVVDVERRVQSALDSPTVVAARKAPRRWRELYVSAPVGGRDRLVEGYIDLLFEDEHGELVVVDYKTDADLDTAVDRYRLQAATYALALEVTLDRPVARAVFVFCRLDGAVEREVADLRVAIEDVRVLAG
jgi:ATP-dependent helicase/nuclease subunit A